MKYTANVSLSMCNSHVGSRSLRLSLNFSLWWRIQGLIMRGQSITKRGNGKRNQGTNTPEFSTCPNDGLLGSRLSPKSTCFSRFCSADNFPQHGCVAWTLISALVSPLSFGCVQPQRPENHQDFVNCTFAARFPRNHCVGQQHWALCFAPSSRIWQKETEVLKYPHVSQDWTPPRASKRS